MDLPPYQYQALSCGHIRVLELLPGAGSRMRHVSLKSSSTPVKYVALSYTWGASTETFPFLCDGRNLPVRKNLLDALLRLRGQVNTPIWIDAMCINQSDDEEKIGQIQLMTDIYRNAQKVLIWLGEEIPETRIAVENICNVTARLRDLKGVYQGIDTIVSSSFIIGIRHILTCAWWQRLWVLQESVLAREAIFVCGSHSIPWKTLSSFVKQVKRLDLCTDFRGNDQHIEYCDGFTEIPNIETVRHTHSNSLGTDLVRICRQRSCFDPRDRVYGVIGLMEQYMREGFTWDPEDKVEELYPPFVAILLQLDSTAILLSLTETTQRYPNLPSWCPDLHYRSVNRLLADHESYHAGFNIQTTPKYDFDPKNWRKIRFKGIAVDTIQSVSDQQWLNDNEMVSENTIQCSEMEQLIGLLQTLARAAEKFVKEDDLWRIFVGDMIGNNDSRLHLLGGFTSIHDHLVRRRWRAEAERRRSAFQEIRAWKPSGEEPSPLIQEYIRCAKKVCSGRRFFTTEAGRVGFGPRLMAVGDTVCIIKCARVPFVLTQHPSLPNTYSLRGEAYVHGLMHGEYLKINKNFYWISLI